MCAPVAIGVQSVRRKLLLHQMRLLHLALFVQVYDVNSGRLHHVTSSPGHQ